MRRTNTIDRLVRAAEEFNRRENRRDGSASRGRYCLTNGTYKFRSTKGR
jgi:hypothetical protein